MPVLWPSGAETWTRRCDAGRCGFDGQRLVDVRASPVAGGQPKRPSGLI